MQTSPRSNEIAAEADGSRSVVDYFVCIRDLARVFQRREHQRGLNSMARPAYLKTDTTGTSPRPGHRLRRSHPQGGRARGRRSCSIRSPSQTDAVLTTGSGRQGHSWVRIPPPPLTDPKPALLSCSQVSRSGLLVAPFSPPSSAEVRRLYTWGAQRGRKKRAKQPGGRSRGGRRQPAKASWDSLTEAPELRRPGDSSRLQRPPGSQPGAQRLESA